MIKRNRKRLMTTKMMIILALMSAISIILSRFCVIYITDQLRLSFGNIPVFVVGLLYGPVAGAAVGGVADFIGSALLSGYGWYPPLTVTPVLIGFIAGLFRRPVMNEPHFLRIAVMTVLANALASICWSTLCLSWLYGTPFLTNFSIRLPFYVIVALLEAIIIFMLFNSSAFKRILSDRKMR